RPIAGADGVRAHQRHRPETRVRSLPVSRGGRLGFALLALATGCRRPASATDPAEAAYHAAVLQFAETSKATQDLSYRDPRFDSILEALDRIQSSAESKPKAMALADRIRSARAAASALDRASALIQAQADEVPPVQPQTITLPPVPKATAAPPAEMPVAAPGGDTIDLAGGAPPAGGLPAGGKRHALPAWYAGYFGGPPPGDGGVAEDSADAEAPPPDPAESAKRKPSQETT